MQCHVWIFRLVDTVAGKLSNAPLICRQPFVLLFVVFMVLHTRNVVLALPIVHGLCKDSQFNQFNSILHPCSRPG